MSGSRLHGTLFRGAIATSVLVAAGCGSGVEGTYESPNGFMSVEFRDDERAYLTTPMATVETAYERDGDRIILRHEDGNLVLTRREDGSLEGPMGTMKKKEDES